MIFMIDTSQVVTKMYFLTKMCRLCVQTKQTLVNLDDEDYDSVSFSKKLEICTKMVIKPQKEVSKEICFSCVHKLRISYDFYTMCKKSTNILNGYVSKLLSGSPRSESNGSVESFPNTNIYVALAKTPIVTHRKKRIGKSERCAAMQKLLSNNQELICSNNQDFLIPNEMALNTPRTDKPRGGLKDLLSFTKSFDFGYNPLTTEEPKDSPLDKLIEFSETFFISDFEDYRQNILCIIQNNETEDDYTSSEESDIEEMFKSCEEEEDDDEIPKVKFEEIILPPNGIKQELDTEMEDDEYEQETADPINYLQVCYNSEIVKKESDEEDGQNNNFIPTLKNNYIFNATLQRHLYQENRQELSLLSKLTESIGPKSKLEERLTGSPKDKSTNSPKNPLYNSPKNPLYNSPKNPLYNSPSHPSYNSPINPLFNSPKNPLYNSPKSDSLTNSANSDKSDPTTISLLRLAQINPTESLSKLENLVSNKRDNLSRWASIASTNRQSTSKFDGISKLKCLPPMENVGTKDTLSSINTLSSMNALSSMDTLAKMENLANNKSIDSKIGCIKDSLPKRPPEPYISPQLKRQYFLCNFKCDTCNRNFKSHGYLKAHNSKVHNNFK